VALFEVAVTQQGFVAGHLWLHSTATYTAGSKAPCQGCFDNCNVVLKAGMGTVHATAAQEAE
jgi:hypothetical protein